MSFWKMIDYQSVCRNVFLYLIFIDLGYNLYGMWSSCEIWCHTFLPFRGCINILNYIFLDSDLFVCYSWRPCFTHSLGDIGKSKYCSLSLKSSFTRSSMIKELNWIILQCLLHFAGILLHNWGNCFLLHCNGSTICSSIRLGFSKWNCCRCELLKSQHNYHVCALFLLIVWNNA